MQLIIIFNAHLHDDGPPPPCQRNPAPLKPELLESMALHLSHLRTRHDRVHLPMTMGYDRFPGQLIDEKTALLNDLSQRRGWLFHTHDPAVAMSRGQRLLAGHRDERMSAVEPLASLVRHPL